MGKSKGQMKRAREEGVAPSVDTMLTAILSVEGESPTAKLIQASELWSAEPAPTEAFFSKVRPYVESLTSSKGVAEDDAEDELMELFEEYEAKSADALLGELDELKSAGVLSKKEAKALKGMSAEEQRRLRVAAPIVMALLLLAFHGVPQEIRNVDVMAHVTGCLWGLALGATLPFLIARGLGSARGQIASAILALLVVALSWSLALTSA